ncbi:MAG: class I SAM-dependent methyltransferase [Candidatus Buchananbacteria bacterium]|jgi:SAM-dependent methyltransferase
MSAIKEFLTAKITRKKLDDFIYKYRDSDKVVLDLGCGDGNYKDLFPKRIGFDHRPGINVDVVGDAHQLPFEDGKFDIILCTEILEHLHSPQIAIKEMERVLKPGGLLLLTTRFVFPLHDVPNDYYRYTKYGLRFLLKDGWDILEFEAESSTKDTIAILLQRIGFQTNMIGGPIAKLFLFLAVKAVIFSPSLIKKEYGDIRHSRIEENIMTSGYHLAAKKI